MDECIQGSKRVLRMIILPIKLLHFDLKLVPIVGFIPSEQRDDIFDLCVTVMWETGGALINLNAV